MNTNKLCYPKISNPVSKQLAFEAAITAEFKHRFKCDFADFQQLIIYERSVPQKQKQNIWIDVGARCQMGSAAAYKYYANTWTKYYLEPWDENLRYNVLVRAAELTIQYFQPEQPEDFYKQLKSKVIMQISDQFELQSAQYFNRHYETLYHAIYSKIQITVKQLQENVPHQKIFSSIVHEPDRDRPKPPTEQKPKKENKVQKLLNGEIQSLDLKTLQTQTNLQQNYVLIPQLPLPPMPGYLQNQLQMRNHHTNPNQSLLYFQQNMQQQQQQFYQQTEFSYPVYQNPDFFQTQIQDVKRTTDEHAMESVFAPFKTDDLEKFKDPEDYEQGLAASQSIKQKLENQADTQDLVRQDQQFDILDSGNLMSETQNQQNRYDSWK